MAELVVYDPEKFTDEEAIEALGEALDGCEAMQKHHRHQQPDVRAQTLWGRRKAGIEWALKRLVPEYG